MIDWTKKESIGILFGIFIAFIVIGYIISKFVVIEREKLKKKRIETELNEITETISKTIKEYTECSLNKSKQVQTADNILITEHIDFKYSNKNPYFKHFYENIKNIMVPNKPSYGFYTLIFRFYGDFKKRIEGKGYLKLSKEKFESVNAQIDYQKFEDLFNRSKEIFERAHSAYECSLVDIKTILEFVKHDFYIAFIHYDKDKAKEIGIANFIN